MTRGPQFFQREQSRLSAAKSCPACKSLWAELSDNFCESHNAQTWHAVAELRAAGQMDRRIPRSARQRNTGDGRPEREVRERSRSVSATRYRSDAVSLSDEALQIREFVEALLDLNSWRVAKSAETSLDLMRWRHHSQSTTIQLLGGFEVEPRRSQKSILSLIARSDDIRDCLVKTGNPVAIFAWLSDKGLEYHWPYKKFLSLETWPIERIRHELLKQELAHSWPKQAMRIISFSLLRDNVVQEVDFERLYKMNSAQLRKQARLLGSSVELEAAKPIAAKDISTLRQTRSQSATVSARSGLEQWLERGDPWILAADLKGAKFRDSLVTLFESGRHWPTSSGIKPPKPPDSDWLDEILARAKDVAPLLRFAPEWPTTFIDRKHRITIAVVDETLVGWIEIGRYRTLLSIDIETWEPKTRGSQKHLDVAIGLVVGWYLDSCICLRKRAHPHFRSDSRRSGRSGTAHQSNNVFLPTPRFLTDIESVSRGSRQTPRAHRVRGHVRELSDLRSPSRAARSNAPYYIRRHLKPNETFVQSHSRGKGEISRAMDVYLSKYSTLADALGSLR